MSCEAVKSVNLKAGEFYGQVPRKQSAASVILTEVVHRRPISVPKHSHELGHFQLLLEGSYSETSGGKSISPSPMTVFWHRPGIVHKDEIGPQGGRFFMIEIQPGSIRQLEQITKLPEDFHIKNDSLVWLACRLYHEFKKWQICSDLVAEGITLEMLGHLARKTVGRDRRQPKWLFRVVERLNEEFAENISTEELALEAKVHPVHLASVFRRFYRQSLGEYVQKLRVAHASRLLLDREIPLAEIAYSVGFADQSHFTRIFKRLTGTTPGAFRDSLD